MEKVKSIDVTEKFSHQTTYQTSLSKVRNLQYIGPQNIKYYWNMESLDHLLTQSANSELPTNRNLKDELLQRLL